MLNIEKNINAAELSITLSGRLDTTSAPELEKEDGWTRPPRRSLRKS